MDVGNEFIEMRLREHAWTTFQLNFNLFSELAAWDQNLSAAGKTNQADIRPQPYHPPVCATARMSFTQSYNIPQTNVSWIDTHN
jgi:hypothetical protein